MVPTTVVVVSGSVVLVVDSVEVVVSPGFVVVVVVGFGTWGRPRRLHHEHV